MVERNYSSAVNFSALQIYCSRKLLDDETITQPLPKMFLVTYVTSSFDFGTNLYER